MAEAMAKGDAPNTDVAKAPPFVLSIAAENDNVEEAKETASKLINWAKFRVHERFLPPNASDTYYATRRSAHWIISEEYGRSQRNHNFEWQKNVKVPAHLMRKKIVEWTATAVQKRCIPTQTPAEIILLCVE